MDDDDRMWAALVKVRATYFPGIEFILDQFQYEDISYGYPFSYWIF